MKNLLDRIDVALKHVGASRQQLADGVGITTQALSNLSRREGSALSAENMAKAARFLRCDFYWFCTGEGGDYVPAATSFSPIVLRIARWIEAQKAPQRAATLAALAEVSQGEVFWANSTQDNGTNGHP